MYIIRLDDASEYMDVKKWDRIEWILDNYDIKPIVGIIPNNKDFNFIDKYSQDIKFWEKARSWQKKNWDIALHGYTHVYSTNSGGINPVNQRSEFAGVTLSEQESKIVNGLKIFKKQNIHTEIFFAPSHTFDLNTLEALKSKSTIRTISDTIANDIYKKNGIYFIPQQVGEVRHMPFKITTFCYHPNTMKEEDFIRLEKFLEKNKGKFTAYHKLTLKDRKLNFYDKLLRYLYFFKRRLRSR